MLLMMFLACLKKPFITEADIEPIAKGTMTVAHPTAMLKSFEIVQIQNSKKTGRFLDLNMVYAPLLGEQSLLSVRYYLLSTEPCKINVEVLGDTGLVPPLLLNEWAAEPALSEFICEGK